MTEQPAARRRAAEAIYESLTARTIVSSKRSKRLCVLFHLFGLRPGAFAFFLIEGVPFCHVRPKLQRHHLIEIPHRTTHQPGALRVFEKGEEKLILRLMDPRAVVIVGTVAFSYGVLLMPAVVMQRNDERLRVRLRAYGAPEDVCPRGALTQTVDAAFAGEHQENLKPLGRRPPSRSRR